MARGEVSSIFPWMNVDRELDHIVEAIVVLAFKLFGAVHVSSA